MTFGPIFFAAPTALFALLALPALFLILRAMPPAPQRMAFPPLRILLGLRTEDEARQRAPLWLVMLRAAMAALVILGLARPSLAPAARAEAALSGPMLVVIDNGWTSAPFWSASRAVANEAVDDAERAGRSVLLLTTAPSRDPPRAIDVLSPAEARNRLARMDPAPLRPDRAAAIKRLTLSEGRFGAIRWISDGLAHPTDQRFAASLMTRGPLAISAPGQTALALTAAGATARGVEVRIRRAPNGPRSGAIAAETAQGRALGAAEFRFGAEDDASGLIAMPPEIASRAAMVKIVGQSSAGAVRLLAGGAGRPLVGLVNPGAQGQPLLSELFYLERALQPFSVTRVGTIESLLDAKVQALVVTDASRLVAKESRALSQWLADGGLLVRFAGPRLANDADELLPVRLRPGSRSLGGALAWEEPQSLTAFDTESPFHGLPVPSDVAVRRQVLAEPASERDARVWARLADGAPLVTAKARGKGLVVLFHVTAGPDWSDLPLSGLYVDMLQRTLAFTGRAASGAQNAGGVGPYRAERVLDGFGVLRNAPADPPTVAVEAFAAAAAGPATPPGLYARKGGPLAPIDAVSATETMASLSVPPGATKLAAASGESRSLGGPLLIAAALILAADLALALALAGRLPTVVKAGAGAMLAWVLLAPLGRAETDPADNLHIAYIITGDAQNDRVVKLGLETLSRTLRMRTAAEPAEPIGVDPATDDLSSFPLIYWRAPGTPRPLSPQATANLDRYMRLGGMLFLDTRDLPKQGARTPAAALLQGLDAPPLELVGADHVLTRSFYLLRAFPGKSANPRLFAETPASAASRDGVASLLVGDGDWAAAWAYDDFTDFAPGLDDRQRETALRFGVNLVMVALTGNYKADQVHVPALLERMGPSERRR